MSDASEASQNLVALENELRRGTVSQESLRPYLAHELPVQVRIELEWMLFAIHQLEEHRERLVRRLAEVNR
jgi:hypothetical protein